MFDYKPTHLIVDGELILPLPTKWEVEWFLYNIVKQIEMIPIAPVLTYETALMLSSIQLIAESHISLTVKKASHMLFLDVFSCKLFDVTKVLVATQSTFSLKNVTHQVVERMVPN